MNQEINTIDPIIPLGIVEMLASMLYPLSSVSEEERTYIEKAVKASVEENGNHATLMTVQIWFAKQESSICQNLAELLSLYTKDAAYADLFDAPAFQQLGKS